MQVSKNLPIIHIIGLPGAGKTTLTRKLSKAFRVPILRIGDYRARFPESALGEADAWLALFRDLSRRRWQNCIVETTGLNSRESFLKVGLPLGQMITIKLEAPRNLLHRRILLKHKSEQGGGWLFSATIPDKHMFVNKFFKRFRSTPADIDIKISERSKTQVYHEVLRALDDICRIESHSTKRL